MATARTRHEPAPDLAREYVRTYLEAIGPAAFLEAVYVETADALSLFSVYRGRFEEVVPKLIAAESRTINAFPDVPVRFEVVDVAHRGALVPASAEQVFPRT